MQHLAHLNVAVDNLRVAFVPISRCVIQLIPFTYWQRIPNFSDPATRCTTVLFKLQRTMLLFSEILKSERPFGTGMSITQGEPGIQQRPVLNTFFEVYPPTFDHRGMGCDVLSRASSKSVPVNFNTARIASLLTDS